MKYGQASKTAELSAMIRTLATNNKYGKMVFDDPYSKWFIGYQTRIIYFINRIKSFFFPAFWASGMNSVGYLLSLCRHKYIFDKLNIEIEHKNLQVLIIGAGYDTNNLLLKNQANTQRFYELDFPATQQRKKSILQKLNLKLKNIEYCEIDLKQKSLNQALLNSSFNINQPTFVIIEGVLSYLTKTEIEKLLTELSEISNHVKIIADYRKPELNQLKNTTAKKWTKSFTKYHEKYVSFYTETEMAELLNKINLDVIENKDLLDLWIPFNNVKPNIQLKNFGGLFIVTNDKRK